MSATFASVEVHRIVHVQHASSADELWAMFAGTMPALGLLRGKLGDDAWSRIAEAARAALREATGPGPVGVEMPAFLTVGR